MNFCALRGLAGEGRGSSAPVQSRGRRFIAGDAAAGLPASSELWRVIIFYLVSRKANTGGWIAQLYVRTEEVQN